MGAISSGFASDLDETQAGIDDVLDHLQGSELSELSSFFQMQRRKQLSSKSSPCSTPTLKKPRSLCAVLAIKRGLDDECLASKRTRSTFPVSKTWRQNPAHRKRETQILRLGYSRHVMRPGKHSSRRCSRARSIRIASNSETEECVQSLKKADMSHITMESVSTQVSFHSSAGLSPSEPTPVPLEASSEDSFVEIPRLHSMTNTAASPSGMSCASLSKESTEWSLEPDAMSIHEQESTVLPRRLSFVGIPSHASCVPRSGSSVSLVPRSASCASFSTQGTQCTLEAVDDSDVEDQTLLDKEQIEKDLTATQGALHQANKYSLYLKAGEPCDEDRNKSATEVVIALPRRLPTTPSSDSSPKLSFAARPQEDGEEPELEDDKIEDNVTWVTSKLSGILPWIPGRPSATNVAQKVQEASRPSALPSRPRQPSATRCKKRGRQRTTSQALQCNALRRELEECQRKLDHSRQQLEESNVEEACPLEELRSMPELSPASEIRAVLERKNPQAKSRTEGASDELAAKLDQAHDQIHQASQDKMDFQQLNIGSPDSSCEHAPVTEDPDQFYIGEASREDVESQPIHIDIEDMKKMLQFHIGDVKESEVTLQDVSQQKADKHVQRSAMLSPWMRSQSVSKVRMQYLKKLSYERVLLPKALQPPSHQTVIIFDWDDTLLCSSYLQLRPRGATLTSDLKRTLMRIARNVIMLLELALSLGQTFIITNAASGWVEQSATDYIGEVLPVLQRVPVLSARSRYEAEYPDEVDQWKRRTFLDLQQQLDSQVITNLVSVGDSLFEREAAMKMGRGFAQVVIKTIKFQEFPTPKELHKQQQHLCRKINQIVCSAKDLRMRMRPR